MIVFVIVDGCKSSTGLSLTIVVALFTLLNYKEKIFMSLMMKIWCLNHELQGICKGFKAKRIIQFHLDIRTDRRDEVFVRFL
jgi:hypothetical protein